MSFIMGIGAKILFELPVRGQSLDALAQGLEGSAQGIATRIENAKESTHNHKTITHLIGIERWGQSRLKVAMGEPLLQDEYDGYRPAQDTAWHALKEHFEATRQQTVELAHALGTQHVNPSQTVMHNMYGDMTLRGWLKYLDVHANLTIKLVR